MRGAISYLDFDLLIRRTEGGYRAQVLSSPAGEAVAEFTPPFSELELENFLLRVGRPRRGTRRIGSPEMEVARTVGKRLYDAVFSGEVNACWRSSLSEAESRKAGLRLRLRIDAPELNDVPWEYLYNPALNQFLSLSLETPLIRYVELPRRIQPLAVDGRLEILVMISNPTDYPGLDVEAEWSRLNEALAGPVGSGQMRLTRLAEARLTVLRRELSRGEYHILHFIGHAGFDRETQDGILVLRDEAGRGRRVPAHHLGIILHDHRSLRLVVLNACEGARASRTDPFAGAAQSLVQQGIPAVIAMQFEITDQAAITFAEAFYAEVADGHPVDAALAEARKAIFAAENDIEWGTPVLYLRAPDGQLFSVNRDVAARQAEEEKRRAEAERQAEEERRRAEAARQVEEERQRVEAARLEEEEQRRAEAARQAAEEKRRAEAARQAAEEKRRAEAARQAEEEKWRAEAARQAEEEKRRAEAARQAEEEKRRAEAARQAEEARQQAEAAQQAEEARQQAEAAQQAAEEKRRAEAMRQAAEEELRAEAIRQAAWQKERAEAARRAEEERNAEAARQEAEENRRAAAARQAPEEKRRAEAMQKAQEEELRAEAIRQAAWQKKQTETARRAEEERNAEAARQEAEESRRAAAARRAMAMRQLVSELAKQFSGQKDVYVAPQIPQAKEMHARAAAGVPETESLWILFDYIVFGSATMKYFLVAGRNGIFYRHYSATPQTFAISYEDLRVAAVVDSYGGGMKIGESILSFAGGNASASRDFLRSLQNRLKAIPR